MGNLFIICMHLGISCFILNTNAKNIDVDEFINKLMASDKIDKLADKIAERAAAKINNIKKIESEDSHHNIIYRATTPSTTNDIKAKSSSKISKDKKEVTKNKPGQIDLDAFLKREAMSPFEGLSLKYKQYTKSVTINSKQIPNKYSVSDKNEKSDVSHLTFESNDYEPSVKNGIDVNQKKQAEFITDVTLENNNDTVEQVMRASDSNFTNAYSTKINNISEELTESSKQNEKLQSEHDIKDDKKTLNENNKKPKLNELRKEFTINTLDDYESDDSGNDSVSNVDLEPIQKLTTKVKKKTKIIHKEGNKVYQLDSSPEYADYHEQILKLQKSKHL